MCNTFCSFFFFFNDTATTEIYTLSLHDALPILPGDRQASAALAEADRLAGPQVGHAGHLVPVVAQRERAARRLGGQLRSEEHTSELQSRLHLVCRLLLEKKKTLPPRPPAPHQLD